MKEERNNVVSDENLDQVSGGVGPGNLRFVSGSKVEVSNLVADPNEKPVVSGLVTGGTEMPTEKLRQMFLNSTAKNDTSGPVSV